MTEKKKDDEKSVVVSVSMSPKRREWWHNQPNGQRAERLGRLIDREIAKENAAKARKKKR